MKRILALLVLAVTLAGCGGPKVNAGSIGSGSPPTSVTFQVNGSGPDGVEITYGTESIKDSPNSVILPWSATLSYNSNTSYYDVSAQLNAGGSITCRVIGNYSGGITKILATGQVSGAYNICDAQANNR